MKLGMALVRLVVGAIFVGHGAQKTMGKFGGYGPDGTGQFFESIGLRPGKPLALAAGGSEMAGGTLLALGWATPLASALLTGVMAQAVRSVHIDKGPWNDNGGWEYPAVIVASLFAITDTGPGALSLDHALRNERSGPGWALAALAAGVGGAFAATELAPGGEAPA
jgi:putative oxidoreductase